jgi:hypothetical protein
LFSNSIPLTSILSPLGRGEEEQVRVQLFAVPARTSIIVLRIKEDFQWTTDQQKVSFQNGSNGSFTGANHRSVIFAINGKDSFSDFIRVNLCLSVVSSPLGYIASLFQSFSTSP